MTEGHSGTSGQQEFQDFDTRHGQTHEHQLGIIPGIRHARIHTYILAGLYQRWEGNLYPDQDT